MLKNKIIYTVIKILVVIILIITITAILINIVVICKTLVEPNKIPDVLGYKAFLIIEAQEDENTNKATVIFTKNTDTKNIKTEDAIVINVNNILAMQKVKEVQKLEDDKYQFKTAENILIQCEKI